MAHSLILYDNDEVEAVFDNCMAVKLSPCGANVILPVETSPSIHPVNQPQILLQRTKFVTHKYRSQVKAALDFRNRFGKKIYLCRDLLQSERILEYYADIKTVDWPTSTSAIAVNPDGSLQLNSLDECATVTLAPNRQEFSALFLCKLNSENNFPQESKLCISKASTLSSKLGRNVYSQRALKDISYKLNFSVEKKENLTESEGQLTPNDHGDTHCRHKAIDYNKNLMKHYVWQVQNESVTQCPEPWRYPLEMLMTKSKSLQESQDNQASLMTEHMTAEGEGCLRKQGNRSHLPASLPEKCPKSHLHQMSLEEKWTPQNILSDDVDDVRVWIKRRRIKVCYFRGVIYRVLWQPEPCLEIYPGDGSILKSMPGEGSYFKYFTMKDGRLQEQILSIKTPPPMNIRCGSHILSSLLKRANRFLSQMKLIDRNADCHSEAVCWEDHQDKPLLPQNPHQLIEEYNIEEIGHFAAFSNGYLRIKFNDRTIIELQVDPLQVHNDDDCDDDDDDGDVNDKATRHDCRDQPSRRPKLSKHQLFPENVCRILLPSGEDYMVDLRNSDYTNRYTQIATQWATWVTLSKRRKFNACRSNSFDVNKMREVGLELEKLQQFNYDLPSYWSTDKVIEDEEMSAATIRRLLERNSAKIQDIDDALKDS